MLDAPADLRQADQFGEGDGVGQVGQPVAGGCLGAGGPFDQQCDLGQDAVPAVWVCGGGLGEASGFDPGRPHPQRQEV